MAALDGVAQARGYSGLAHHLAINCLNRNKRIIMKIKEVRAFEIALEAEPKTKPRTLSRAGTAHTMLRPIDR